LATLIVDYSTGIRKKLGLAAALLHGPRLLVLDEPFEAVDPLSAATVRSILTQFVAGGGSVVMSSHVMALVEQVCDRVAVMAAGRVVVAGHAVGGLSWLRSYHEAAKGRAVAALRNSGARHTAAANRDADI
jgi:ABC-type multidrug transport system ATPase subunit